jgi:hypothetical protein
MPNIDVGTSAPQPLLMTCTRPIALTSLRTSGSGRLELALAEIFGQEVATLLVPLPARTVGAGRFTGFLDPDGNEWSVQQMPDWS